MNIPVADITLSEKSSGNCNDYKLIKSIVRKAVPEPECARISRNLLKQFGDVASILHASSSEIMTKGEAPRKIAEEFSLTSELIKAVTRNKVLDQPLLDNYHSVLDYCRVMLAGERREQFHALFLDKSYYLIAHECLQVGTVDHVSVYPREILANALNHSACAIILLHNHPSGNIEPSAGDLKMTRMLMTAGSYFGIAISDHIIVSRTGSFSFRERGLIDRYQRQICNPKHVTNEPLENTNSKRSVTCST